MTVTQDLITESSPDSSLIAAIKSPCSQTNDALTILINRHSGTFHNTVAKHGSKKPWLFTDFIADKPLFFYQKVLSFDETKNASFCTYLTHCVRWACLGIFSEDMKKTCIDIEELNQQADSEDFSQMTGVFGAKDLRIEDFTTEDSRKSLEFSDNLSYIKEELKNFPPLEQQIMNARFFPEGNKSTNWKQVSNETGICAYWAMLKKDGTIKKLQESIS